MATFIVQRSAPSLRADVSSVERVCALLPVGLAREIRRAEADLQARGESIEEIRVRGGRRAFLTVGSAGGKKNLALESYLSPDELADTLKRMCGGSLYTYSDSIVKGYLSLGDGIRVGVCGRAATERGRILGVYDISSLNVRLPRINVRVDSQILSFVRKTVANGKGVLIYSPPAQGKTTLLRSLARELSGGASPLRLTIVDSREELALSARLGELSADILSGYPKAEAIHIATAFMNPEAVICDEIGGEDDVRAICEAQNCGVPLIASAHGEDIRSLMRRPSMLALYETGAFGLFVGLRISSEGFRYTLHGAKEVEKIIENGGNDNACDKRDIPLLAKA